MLIQCWKTNLLKEKRLGSALKLDRCALRLHKGLTAESILSSEVETKIISANLNNFHLLYRKQKQV